MKDAYFLKRTKNIIKKQIKALKERSDRMSFELEDVRILETLLKVNKMTDDYIRENGDVLPNAKHKRTPKVSDEAILKVLSNDVGKNTN